MFEKDSKDQMVCTSERNIEKMHINKIGDGIRRRRWSWIGHILRGKDPVKWLHGDDQNVEEQQED